MPRLLTQTLVLKVKAHCEHESNILTHFVNNLSSFSKVLFMTGSLKLPFSKHINDMIRRLTAVSVHKIMKIGEDFVAKGTVRPGGLSTCFSALTRWSMNDNLSLHHIL